MKRKLFMSCLLIASVVVATWFTGCYPHEDSTVEDWDISVSIKNPNFDKYGSIRSYYLFSEVSHGEDKEDQEDIERPFDEKIINTVRENLNNLGWTQSVNAEQADVVVFCSAINTDIYTYWYDYWYQDYWIDYYPGYYPYFPGAYYSGISYEYTEGTVAIQMNWVGDEVIDNGQVEAPVIWLALLDGLLNDTQADINKRIVGGINQCFTDSPYLNGERK